MPRTISLSQALQDNATLYMLRQTPETFRFRDGVSLVLAILPIPPSLVIKEGQGGNFTVTGETANIIDILAQTLNFKYSLVQPPDRAWGAMLSNGSWTGLIGMIMSGAADMVMAPICQTPARTEAVGFAWPVARVSGKLVALKEGIEIDPWGAFLPLTPAVWLGLVLTLLALWIIVLAVDTYKTELAKPWYIRAADVFLQFIRILLVQGDNSSQNSVLTRYLFGSWACLVAVLIWSYNCNLIALLATRHIGLPIQSLQDLIDHPNMGLVLQKYSVFASAIEQAETGILKQVGALRKKGRLVFVERGSHQEGLDKYVSKGTHVFLTGHGNANEIVTQHYSKTGRCDLYIAKETILPYGCSYILKKGSPLLPAINYKLGLLENGGFLQGMGAKDAPVNASACKNAPNKITVMEAFSVASVQGMFIVLIVGLMFATISFFLELLVGRR